ncbi:MAG: polysaccharide deacetylase family protein [Acetobacteraceae bacterium]|nr:polysaccharide deacetylase family protein [Acetobacteraceae bacterium]
MPRPGDGRLRHGQGRWALEPEIVAYSPLRHRPRLAWPGGARVALWLCPNIEHYEFLPAFQRRRDPWPRSPHPDVLGYSQRDYGNRVGLWRLFEATDALGIRCTVSLSMAVLQHYPAIAEAMLKRDWELMSHGIYNTRYHWDFSPAEERAAMQESRDIHRRVVGSEQAGWFSPAATNTLNTFDLLAETGFDYTCDLYHDDQPTPLRTRTPRPDGSALVSVPYTMELNDVIASRRGEEIGDFCRAIRDHFDTVYAEGGEQGRVMCVAIHPFWIGQPGRIRRFREVMAGILSHPGVWCTTAQEIAATYRRDHLPAVQAHLAAREALHG